MEVDVRTAARAANNLAALRYRVGEIAEHPLTHASIRRDLLAALSDAEF